MASRLNEWVSAAVELNGSRSENGRAFTFEEIKGTLDKQIAQLGLTEQAFTEVRRGATQYVNYEGPSEEPLAPAYSMGFVTIRPNQRLSEKYL